MDIVSSSQGVPTILIPEKFDYTCLAAFKSTYMALLSEVKQILVIDLVNTRYIDSSALGVLIVCRSVFHGKGKSIHLCNASDDVKKVLLISRFDKKFEIT